MNFKPALWHPIAVALSVLNVGGAGFALATREPLHAAVHVALAFVFGLWARRLRQTAGGGERQARLEEGEDRLDALDAEVSRLREELSETQERLDFAERLLAQRKESPRVGQER